MNFLQNFLKSFISCRSPFEVLCLDDPTTISDGTHAMICQLSHGFNDLHFYHGKKKLYFTPSLMIIKINESAVSLSCGLLQHD